MEIDVKRLSTNSGQGTVAFKNKVKLRNLMRILRCCVELEENISWKEEERKRATKLPRRLGYHVTAGSTSDVNHSRFMQQSGKESGAEEEEEKDLENGANKVNKKVREKSKNIKKSYQIWSWSLSRP
ncbi:hypothetical protein YC2023_095372 [Brassica napus]